MKYVVKSRKDETSYITESHVVEFLYSTTIGRCIIKFISLPFISKSIGFLLNTRFSKFKIKSFINKNNIDINLYEDVNYKSFNDFFTRKKKEVNVNMNDEVLISPSDAKVSVYNINEDSLFSIKDSYYSVSDLVNSDPLYEKYIGGLALIFRLEATDYHRYIYIDDCSHEKSIYVKGVLNTVRPIVLNHYNIYKRNAREYTMLHTSNFGDVMQIEVGALLVGKINNFYDKGNHKRGEEKGMFEFGGSTIVLLVEKDKVIIDEDILENSLNNIETIVKCGEKIGKKILKNKI